MKQNSNIVLLLVASFCGAHISLQASPVSAAETYRGQKQICRPIEVDAWLDEATIDPYKYFVVGKKADRSFDASDASVEFSFFEEFNWLVEKQVFDRIDCQIVWLNRDGRSNENVIGELPVTRNTYFDRLARIREKLREQFPGWELDQ